MRATAARRPVSRRAFVRVALPAVGAAAAAVTGLAAWSNWVQDRVTWFGLEAREYVHTRRLMRLAPAERIRRHFGYLRLDAADVDRFVADYRTRFGRRRLAAPDRLDEMLDVFLLSTDFFPRGADERNAVRYVALYDPYARPCWNPFPNTTPPSGAGA